MHKTRGAIVAWNVPLFLAINKLGPALLAVDMLPATGEQPLCADRGQSRYRRAVIQHHGRRQRLERQRWQCGGERSDASRSRNRSVR